MMRVPVGGRRVVRYGAFRLQKVAPIFRGSELVVILPNGQRATVTSDTVVPPTSVTVGDLAGLSFEYVATCEGRRATGTTPQMAVEGLL